ncbi:P-type ATPase [Effusibacillus pohliae]|uniref:P-type ATPase n=1 Tax=Effusibacillus pohliae TaxID=232270 RepID=UPI00035F9731|nr:cation transporting ATPase C-terminal domain-containing protein [Effusibacillus pohliae]
MIQMINRVGRVALQLTRIPAIFLQNLVTGGQQPNLVQGQLQQSDLMDGWEKGLTSEQATARLQQHGYNHYRPQVGRAQLFGEHFKNVAALSLLGFGALALAIGKYADAAIVFLVFAVSAAYATRLKLRSEQSYRHQLEQQKTATVLRDGKLCQVAPARVVPGDIVFLRQGDVVPADCVILRCTNLQVREMDADSSFRVMLKCAANSEFGQPVRLHAATDANRLVAGSVVIGGAAQALVTATGNSTRHASIFRKPKHQHLFTETRYNQFSKQLTKIGWVVLLLAAGLVLAVGWPAAVAVETASAVATSVIPGGFSLPICLAFWTAVQRTGWRGQDLPSLHHVDRLEDTKLVVLSEQALTQDMHPSKLWCPQSHWTVAADVQDHEHAGKLLFYKSGIRTQPSGSSECLSVVQAARLFARVDGEWGPYDRAVNRLYSHFQVPTAFDVSGWPWIDHTDLPEHGLFEMRAFQVPGGPIVEVVRGPAELLFESCRRVMGPEQNLALLNPDNTVAKTDGIRRSLEDWLETARRHHECTVGFAYRLRGAGTLPQPDGQQAAAKQETDGLIWIGALAFRRTYQASSQLLQRFAKLGLPVVLTVHECVLQDPTFRKAVVFENANVRILPASEFLAGLEHGQAQLQQSDMWIVAADERERLQVLRKLREQFSDVCFIGCCDQERAYYGAVWMAIEQGIRRGLQDIVETLEETRHARSRIGHANGFILSGNIGEAVYSIVSGLAGAHHALSPVIVNLLTGTVASIGLAAGRRGMDPSQPHQNSDLGHLHKPIVTHGIVSGSISLLAYAGGLLISDDPLFAATFAFATLILSQLWQAFHWRRQSRLAKLSDLWEDRVLAIALFASLAILALSIHLPGLSQLLQTTPLALQDWLVAAAIAGGVGPVASTSEQIIWPLLERIGKLLQRSRSANQGAAA